jgi:NAD(P)-dependent dehydrogenase (short-subunit alcohol dehydrogenase family)
MESFNITSLFSVKGKVALVTGGSRGIGLMIARGYVANGVRVYISSRKTAVCERVAAELSEFGDCIAIPANLTTNEGREKLVAALKEREEKLDILVNNAGAAWGAPFEEFPEQGYDRTFDLNVKSLFLLTRDLVGLLEAAASQSDPARVINIGSIDGLSTPTMPNFPYAASKAAVHHLTRVLANELGRRYITVNAIAPGPFDSQMTKFFLGNEETRAQIAEGCPLGRVGEPEDMAGIALYLASRAASYVNGVVIPVDGGIIINGRSDVF